MQGNGCVSIITLAMMMMIRQGSIIDGSGLQEMMQT
jgi:hypothetical protein